MRSAQFNYSVRTVNPVTDLVRQVVAAVCDAMQLSDRERRRFVEEKKRRGSDRLSEARAVAACVLRNLLLVHWKSKKVAMVGGIPHGYSSEWKPPGTPALASLLRMDHTALVYSIRKYEAKMAAADPFSTVYGRFTGLDQVIDIPQLRTPKRKRVHVIAGL